MFMNNNHTVSWWHRVVSAGLMVTFLVYSGIMVFDFQGAVVCVGSNGHFAIEAAEANQHVSGVTSRGVPQWSGHMLSDESCRDVPLETSVLIHFLPGKLKWEIFSLRLITIGRLLLNPFSPAKINTPYSQTNTYRVVLQQFVTSTVLLI